MAYIYESDEEILPSLYTLQVTWTQIFLLPVRVHCIMQASFLKNKNKQKSQKKKRKAMLVLYT